MVKLRVAVGGPSPLPWLAGSPCAALSPEAGASSRSSRLAYLRWDQAGEQQADMDFKKPVAVSLPSGERLEIPTATRERGGSWRIGIVRQRPGTGSRTCSLWK